MQKKDEWRAIIEAFHLLYIELTPYHANVFEQNEAVNDSTQM